MRYGKRIFAAAFAGLLTVSCIFPSYATKTAEESPLRFTQGNGVDDAKNKASSLQNEKDELANTLKELEGYRSDTAAYVQQLDGKLSDLNKQMAALSARIDVKNGEIDASAQEISEAEAVETQQYESMKLRIQYMYEKGETNYLDLLFGSADLTQLFKRVEYISQMSAYDKKMLDLYAQTKLEVRERKKVLEAEQEELTALQESTRQKQEQAEQLVDAKSAELKSYQNKIANTQGSLSKLDQDIADQEARIKAIEAEIARKEEEARKAAQEAGKKYNTVSIGNINFIWPCPSSSRVTSNFGDRESPTEGASSNHQGTDIGAAAGSSIVAAASGTVTIATYSYSAGNYVMINHGGGVSTVYMHCSELLVAAGAQVTQGQVIAKVGSTGYSTGAHLHFGVRLNGSYVNPLKYVSP